MRYILKALEPHEEISNLEEEENTIMEEMEEVLEKRQKDKLPALGDKPEKKFLKFCVNLKYTALQRLINYFVQELLLLQICWE